MATLVGLAVPRHFVYIVVCADGTLYTGYSTDPERRVAEHNSGRGARYTRSRGPVRLAYLEEVKSRESALRRELQVKRMNRREKQLLCGRFERGAPS